MAYKNRLAAFAALRDGINSPVGDVGILGTAALVLVRTPIYAAIHNQIVDGTRKHATRSLERSLYNWLAAGIEGRV